VQDGEGRFSQRDVLVGIESGDRVAIRRGLAEGERVVVSGQFLIDSEASVSKALKRIAPEAPDPEPSTTEHSGMDHSDMDHSGMDHSGMDHSGHDMSGMEEESRDQGGNGP
jgi:Cu(I)/Ag(I) efflux system membrane fusion protein